MRKIEKHRKRLLWQLYPSYLIITLVALLAVSWYMSGALKDFFMEQKLRDLEARASFFKEMFSEFLTPGDRPKIDELCKRIGKKTGTRVTVILASGVVVGDSDQNPETMENHGNRSEIRGALQGGVGNSIRYSSTLGERMMYAAIPVKNENRVMAVVRTAVALTAIDRTFESIRTKIVWAGVFIAIFAAGVCLYVSRRLSLPLERMKEGAQLFAKGDLSHRLPIPNTRELAGLALAMNQMANQLDEKMKSVVRHRNELEAVLASMKEGVIAMDQEERILSINQAAAAMFNKDPWEMESRSIQETIRNADMQKFVKSALKNGGALEADITMYQADERVLNLHSTRLLDAKGEAMGILVVLNDVTRLRRLENMRRDFVANVSHEIKTPLTAIQGFVETLLQDSEEVSENTFRFLNIIDRHVHRLVAILEDLLDLSRIESDGERKYISFVETPVEDVVQTAIQVVESKANSKNIRIDFDFDNTLMADMEPPLMEQAVVNLLDNAIKYSSPGSTVEVKAEDAGKDVRLSIRDCGVGIAKDHLPRLFERFYRVDKARSRNMGGTGLGLAIVKHIVQAHEGTVSVESAPGKGSVFTLIFPQKTSAGHS